MASFDLWLANWLAVSPNKSPAAAAAAAIACSGFNFKLKGSLLPTEIALSSRPEEKAAKRFVQDRACNCMRRSAVSVSVSRLKKSRARVHLHLEFTCSRGPFDSCVFFECESKSNTSHFLPTFLRERERERDVSVCLV